MSPRPSHSLSTMTSSLPLFLAISAVLVATSGALWTAPRNKTALDSDKPLFLTPFIRNGHLSIAKEECRVKPEAGMDLESYSGYLTVRDLPDDANIFFWFFPVVHNKSNTPVLLWLTGGPGSSLFDGLFAECGPYSILSNGTFIHRHGHWATTFNVIFMDVPVGTGYSFASSTAFYNQNLTAIGKDLLEGIQQFFTLFSEYVSSDFYIVGESYAGKYAVILAQELHRANQSNDVSSCSSFPINLKGIIGISAFLTPNEYLGITDFIFTNGLLTAEQDTQLSIQEMKYMNAVWDGNWDVANTISMTRNTSKIAQLFTSYAGFVHSSYLHRSFDPHTERDYAPFVQRVNVRRALHVGAMPFHPSVNQDVLNHVDDLTKSVALNIESLLDFGYRVLLAYGTSDISIPPLAAKRMIDSFQWKGAAQFNATAQVIWKIKDNEEVAGYIIPGDYLWFSLVRNAGHLIPIQQPQAALDLVTRFIFNNTIFRKY